jgi:hypothetical protein
MSVKPFENVMKKLKNVDEPSSHTNIFIRAFVAIIKLELR